MKLRYSDIAAREARLTVSEAVALTASAARELKRADHDNRGLPPPEQILLTSDGGVRFDAAQDEADESQRVRQLAALLHGFLPLDRDGSDGGRDARVPGALLVLLARATGQIDAPAPSFARFTEALSRFSKDDTASLKCLYWRCVGRDRDVASENTPPATVLPWREPAEPTVCLGDRRKKHRRAAEFQRDFRRTRQRMLLQRAALACGALVCVAGGGAGGWFLASSLNDRAQPQAPVAISAAAAPDSGSAGATFADVMSAEPATGDAPVVHERDVSPRGERPRRSAGTHRARPSSTGFATAAPAAPLVLARDVGADAFSPSFDQRGRSVLFHAGRDRAALMRASIADDGEVRVDTVLRDGAANYHATLSPDGEQLAFDSDRESPRGVYVARSDASEPRRISGEGYAAVPSWSPDGRRLTFVKADPRRPRVWNVWVADLDAGTLAQVSDHRVGQAWRAPWFPDGERIAYSVEDRLVIANLATGDSRVFRSPVRGRLVRTPAVSPDGRSIVFQLHGDGAWLLDVATGRMRRVLADRSAEEFAWSPDGMQVAYHTRRAGAWSVWQASLGESTDREPAASR